MANENGYYSSAFTGAEIDDAVSKILSGYLDDLVQTAEDLADQAKASANASLQNTPKFVSVTIPAGYGASDTCEVTVPGIMADEQAQVIMVMPSYTSQMPYRKAGIRCTGQGENKLIFSFESTLESEVTVYVTMQEVEVV